MSAQALTKSEKIRYINIAVVLLLMFGFRYLPTFSSLFANIQYVNADRHACTRYLYWCGLWLVNN